MEPRSERGQAAFVGRFVDGQRNKHQLARLLLETRCEALAPAPRCDLSPPPQSRSSLFNRFPALRAPLICERASDRWAESLLIGRAAEAAEASKAFIRYINAAIEENRHIHITRKWTSSFFLEFNDSD